MLKKNKLEKPDIKELKVGDIVTMDKNSRYYGSRDRNSSNPSNILGTIATNDGKSIRVNWANGKTNTYMSSDLEKVKEPNDKKLIMVLNYNKTVKTFPLDNRIPKNLTEQMLDEIEKSALLTILQRYDKCLEYNETIIDYLYELLEKNITDMQMEIKTIRELKEKLDNEKETKTEQTKKENPSIEGYSTEIYAKELKDALYKEAIENQVDDILEKQFKDIDISADKPGIPGDYGSFYSSRNIPIESFKITHDPAAFVFNENDYIDNDDEYIDDEEE